MDYQHQNLYHHQSTSPSPSTQIQTEFQNIDHGTPFTNWPPYSLWFTPGISYISPHPQFVSPLNFNYSSGISLEGGYSGLNMPHSDSVRFNCLSDCKNFPNGGIAQDAPKENVILNPIKIEEQEIISETVNKKDNQIQEKKKKSLKNKESQEKCQDKTSNLNKPQKQLKAMSKRKLIDKDYIPHRSQKKEIRKRLHQNENRNVVPNQINQILSFLQKRTKSEHILNKIWSKIQPSEEYYSISRFYLYQNMLKQKSGHYSNQQQLRLLGSLYQPQCRIWSLNEQRHYINLSRMLVGHFLRQDCIPIILTSKRMKSTKKSEHLKMRREVARRVKQLMGEGRGEETR